MLLGGTFAFTFLLASAIDPSAAVLILVFPFYILAAYMAKKRGRSPIVWLLLINLLTPLLTIPVLWMAGDKVHRA